MPVHILVFNIVSVLGVVMLGGYFWSLSRRERRVHPGLWVMLGNFSIFWLEGPYDKFGFCNYHPAHWMFPRQGWGPLSAPFSGLPVLVAFSYVVYFTVPAMIAVGIARKILAGRDLSAPYVLLTVGLAFGVVWDIVWENIGVAVGIWRFESANPGMVLKAGQPTQYPLYISLAMAIMVMFATYLLGREDASGRPILERWAATKTHSATARTTLTGMAVVVLSHVVYLPTMVPFWITYAAGMQTERVRSAQLFAGYRLPRQPVTFGAHPEWGTPIMFAVLTATAAAVYFGVWRWDVLREASGRVISASAGSGSLQRPESRTAV